MTHSQKYRLWHKLFAVTIIMSMLFGATTTRQPKADKGSYSTAWLAADPTDYERYYPGQLAPVFGRANDPLANADYADGVPSLEPKDMMLGQIVPYEVEIE